MSESLKQGWKDRIKEIPGDYISVKELAFILQRSYNKVRYDMKKGVLKYTKMGSESSKAWLEIKKEDAIEYIESFYSSDADVSGIDETPQSKFLPFFDKQVIKKI